MGNNLRQVQDTKIMQKVNAVSREAFLSKYPGQIEHILRLLCEKMQMSLDKRGANDPTDSSTWLLSPAEYAELAQSIYHINEVHQSIKLDTKEQ
jgi:hypothetical protein